MNPLKPMDPMEHRCTATNRQGNRCGKPAIPGGVVCRLHGGSAPQVLAKAKERLLKAVDPVAGELVAIALGKKVSKKDQVRAIEGVMDRAGLPAESKVQTDVNLTVAEESRQRLRKFFPYDEDGKAA